MQETADSLLRSDSLRLAVERMFLQGAQYIPISRGDTLPDIAPATTAADIYGAVSTLAPATYAPISHSALTASAAFQVLALIMTAAYILIMYHRWSDVGTLFMRTSFDKGSAFLSEVRAGSSHRQFLNIMVVAGLLFMGLFATKGFDLWLPPGTLPTGAGAGVSLLATAILMCLVGVQIGALHLIGGITFTRPFTTELIFIKRTLLTLSTIWGVPPLLLFVLCPPNTGKMWLYIIIAEVIILTLIYLYKTFTLFISKKVSILLWFLYLCAIELFPISLLWLLATR